MTKQNFFLRNMAIGIACLAATAVFTACEPNEGDPENTITVSNSSALTQTVAANATQGETLTITTTAAWSATVLTGAEWLSVSPAGGEAAGTYDVTVALLPNNTGTDRTATVKIACGSFSLTLALTQSATTESGGEVKKIAKVTESAVFNSDYYSSGAAYEPYMPHTLAFTYDNSGRLKEAYANNELGLTWNYDIAGEVRISDETEDSNHTTFRATLSNGKVSKIQWGADDYNPAGYIADLTYNADGYLTEHTSTYTYLYGDCNAQRFVWNGGNLTGLQVLNCTTQVYNNYAVYEYYAEELNDKTNLDLNVLFSDILSISVLDNESRIYQVPAAWFALNGLTGKRSKNYLKRETTEREMDYPKIAESIYTEATAPAVGDVLGAYYDREFDGNFNYTFDANGYPTKLNRQVKVTKNQTIYDGGTREYVEPRDESERESWTHIFGAGPWFYMKNMQTHDAETVKNDIYTWTIEYRQ